MQHQAAGVDSTGGLRRGIASAVQCEGAKGGWWVCMPVVQGGTGATPCRAEVGLTTVSNDFNSGWAVLRVVCEKSTMGK